MFLAIISHVKLDIKLDFVYCDRRTVHFSRVLRFEKYYAFVIEVSRSMCLDFVFDKIDVWSITILVFRYTGVFA